MNLLEVKIYMYNSIVLRNVLLLTTFLMKTVQKVLVNTKCLIKIVMMKMVHLRDIFASLCQTDFNLLFYYLCFI